MSARTPGPRQRKRFLEHFAMTLNVTESAKVAGFARATAYRLRDRDATFAAEWLEAEAQAIDRVQAAAYRYATQGAEERTYDETGKLVSRRVREDPTSAARLLAAHLPDVYSEKRRLEVLGRVEHEVVPPRDVITLADLTRGELEAGEPAGEIIDEQEGTE